jgi:hypothetical protein
MQKKHLVKKSKEFADKGLVMPGKGIHHCCETRVNGAPSGHQLEVGDTVYIAEAGYAIISEGKVLEVRMEKVSSLEELFAYALRSSISGDKYWFSIAMDKIFLNKKFRYLSIMEYTMESEPLPNPVPLEKAYSKQSSWYYLPEDFSPSVTPCSLELSPDIPTTLRCQIYYKWMIGKDSCFVDVDHFVPKSVGGPGNIEENLHLVSLSINRRKSNNIPAGLFIVGDEWQLMPKRSAKYAREARKLLEGDATPFFSDAESKRVAADIVRVANTQPLADARQFYEEIKSLHMEG